MSKGRLPDWDLSALDKDNGAQSRIGAAWSNEDGTISLVLNPCVVIRYTDNVSIRLFKRGQQYQQKPQQARTPIGTAKPGVYDNAQSIQREDDTPF